MTKTLKSLKQVDKMLSYSKYIVIVEPMIKNFGKEIIVTPIKEYYYDDNGYMYHSEWFK